MDLSSIGGLIIGLVAVIVGMFFKGVPFSALANPAAFLIIIVGTVGAVTIATPLKELLNIGKLFGVVFSNTKFMSPNDAIAKILEFAEMARREGLLVLEARIQEESDPFLVRGLQLLVDGVDSDQLSEAMEADIAAMENRHAANANIFTQAGTYAPTLGVLGAVLGLIAALGHMDDTEALGHAIAAAFVATLLGIFTGYVLWHPMANKLKRKSRQEVLVRTIIMEGIVGICRGMNPRMLRDNLSNYIAARERDTGQ
ncbi:MAG: flagellar motor stator protein MotA [Clostridiales Family XIII bacterium]|jgi:chemotaxis protein MotA|nr:flagellar motor stator protein MotA [Clostridiales Family XIII bacterium]